MIYVDMDELVKAAKTLPDYIQLGRWVNDKHAEKLFRKCYALAKVSQIPNGTVDACCNSHECVGCAECGLHEYSIPLDEHTRLNFGWNNWRGYQNGLRISAYNHERDYWEDIYHCYNSTDVTSWKQFWLTEFDRKYLLHVNLQAIMQIKKWKTEHDPNQTKIEEHQL